MLRIVVLLLFCTLLFADNLEVLNQNRQNSRELERQYIKAGYESLKNEWISPVTFDANLGRTHSFSDEKDRNKDNRYRKSASIGFNQYIFESGGIELTIQYAQDRYKYDSLTWENDNQQLLQTIYNTLLQISKLRAQIIQGKYKLENANIALIIKKIEYEAGKTDITEFNNALMNKNMQINENIALDNALKDQEYELSKYTDLKYDEIEILDFGNVSKEDFINKNLDILQEDSRVEMLNTSYERTKTDYLPKVSLGLNADYANSNESEDAMIKDTNKDNAESSATLNFSMPLYDYNKSIQLQLAKIDYLRSKSELIDLKNEIDYNYEQILNQIDTYEKQNETITENIRLYDDLINASKISSDAGMTSVYDLDTLKNSKLINEYDLVINDINIKLEYSLLYFKIKR